jgi:hypothetical protein
LKCRCRPWSMRRSSRRFKASWLRTASASAIGCADPAGCCRVWRYAVARPLAHGVARATGGGRVSIPVEISPEVPVENSSLHCVIRLCRQIRATVLEAVKGRALWRAPRAVSSLDRSCLDRLLRAMAAGAGRDERRPSVSTGSSRSNKRRFS